MGHARLVSGRPVASTECSAAGWRHSEFPAMKKSGQVLVRTMSSKSGELPKDSGGMSGVLNLGSFMRRIVLNVRCFCGFKLRSIRSGIPALTVSYGTPERRHATSR
jgi:hypothetical protein